MKLYVVLRVALQGLGEFSMSSIELATTDEQKALDFMSQKPSAWSETIQNVQYFCERSVCEVELE
jgi:hypothetical protein